MTTATRTDSLEPVETHSMQRRGGTYRLVARRIGHFRDGAMDRAERTMRDVKRSAVRGRYALEDARDAARLGVRHYPGRSMALAFLAGSVATLVVGLLIRRRFSK
jgi:hypothetical protein